MIESSCPVLAQRECRTEHSATVSQCFVCVQVPPTSQFNQIPITDDPESIWALPHPAGSPPAVPPTPPAAIPAKCQGMMMKKVPTTHRNPTTSTQLCSVVTHAHHQEGDHGASVSQFGDDSMSSRCFSHLFGGLSFTRCVTQ